MSAHLANLAYLVASCLFIYGLKLLGSPRSAPRGNFLAAIGMLIAVVAVLAAQESYFAIFVGILIGSAIGAFAAQVVQMTAMPQMVALFNGLGGAASALVAASEFTTYTADPGAMLTVPLFLGTLIGALTLTGSLLAFGKLQGWMTGSPVTFPFQKAANAALFLGCVVLGVLVVADPLATWPFVLLCIGGAVLGVSVVLPIGGADMPVVISLLNSYSGLAACATGFVLQNNALIIAGSLVGASGIILTRIMCKAMNRSLVNVLFGAFGQEGGGAPAGAAGGPAGTVKSASPDEVAMLLDAANSVIVVPGYGMAVAQAQHQVRELDELLQSRGAEVLYAIHPVAGRMPGHMNVLLAEADVPYEQLLDMEAVNPRFGHTDVAIVIGANDVTNPAARTDTASPIYGMPILDVDKARTVIVLKRSMSPGFAGVDNALFYQDNTLMAFGDAKDTVTRVTHALKELAAA